MFCVSLLTSASMVTAISFIRMYWDQSEELVVEVHNLLLVLNVWPMAFVLSVLAHRGGDLVDFVVFLLAFIFLISTISIFLLMKWTIPDEDGQGFFIQ